MPRQSNNQALGIALLAGAAGLVWVATRSGDGNGGNGGGDGDGDGDGGGDGGGTGVLELRTASFTATAVSEFGDFLSVGPGGVLGIHDARHIFLDLQLSVKNVGDAPVWVTLVMDLLERRSLQTDKAWLEMDSDDLSRMALTTNYLAENGVLVKFGLEEMPKRIDPGVTATFLQGYTIDGPRDGTGAAREPARTFWATEETVPLNFNVDIYELVSGTANTGRRIASLKYGSGTPTPVVTLDFTRLVTMGQDDGPAWEQVMIDEGMAVDFLQTPQGTAALPPGTTIGSLRESGFRFGG